MVLYWTVHSPAAMQYAPMSQVTSQVYLECPSCGNAGTVRLLSDGPGTPQGAAAPDGFFVSPAVKGGLQIGCSDCRTVAYELINIPGADTN
jgi:hypothetical protein